MTLKLHLKSPKVVYFYESSSMIHNLEIILVDQKYLLNPL